MISMLFSILRRDIIINFSYPLRIVFQFAFIFLQLLIFFYLSNFLDFNESIKSPLTVNSLFGYFMTGICLLDISYTIISYGSMQIEDHKKTGVFEENFVGVTNPLIYLFLINIFPLLLSIIKFLFYIFLTSFIFGEDISIDFKLILICFFSCLLFISIGIIAIGFTLYFKRGSFISSFHNTISIFFCGIFFPASYISEWSILVSYLLPLYPLLNILREAFGIISITNEELDFMIKLSLTQSLIYFSIGLYLCNIAFKRSQKKGELNYF